MKADVAVIGGGVAGTVAALRARAAGRSVVVVSMGWGASALTPGLFGFAAQSLASRAVPGRDAIHALARSAPWHPYAAFPDPVYAIDEAVRFFRAGPAALRLGGDSPEAEPLLVADDRGGLRCADLALATQARGTFRGARATAKRVVGVVDPIGLSWFHAHSVAKRLESALTGAAKAGAAPWCADTAVLGVDFFRRQADALTSATELARMLDVDETAAQFSAAVCEALSLTRVDALLFPPFLGLDGSDGILDRLEADTGLPCAELVGSEPGPGGFRVQRALEAMLGHAGVPIMRARVCAHEASGRLVRVLALSADSGESTVLARAVVLATGRFIGGGIDSGRPWREAVFGLPLGARAEFLDGEPPGMLVRDAPFESQALFAAGVRVDTEWRPLDLDRRPRFDNLFAAGDVLGGHDGVADGSAMGVALATGHAAGRNAATV